jgi:hypothetical protein
VNRRTVLIGGAATVAGAGFAAWARRDIGAWRDAVAAIRRPLAPGPSGQAALGELVRCATLAANSHNTQPWRFALGESAIAVLPDFARRTPVVDPDDHHLFASLGAAVENIVQAAPIFGLSAKPRFDPGGDGRIVVDLRAGGTATSEMAAAIVKRQCTRAVYDGRAVPVPDLQLLAAAGRADGSDVVLLTDRTAIDAVAALVIDGNTWQLREAAFRDELKHWLRFSYAAALSTGDGLFALTTGNPALPGPLGRMLFDAVVSVDSENRKCLAQIAGSAGLAVFVSERNDRAHWVASGRAYQRFALQATALGIRHAFLNQAVEVSQVRRHLAEHLALGERRPDLIVRFGYADAMPPSLRRPVAAVLA